MGGLVAAFDEPVEVFEGHGDPLVFAAGDAVAFVDDDGDALPGLAGGLRCPRGEVGAGLVLDFDGEVGVFEDGEVVAVFACLADHGGVAVAVEPLADCPLVGGAFPACHRPGHAVVSGSGVHAIGPRRWSLMMSW